MEKLVVKINFNNWLIFKALYIICTLNVNQHCKPLEIIAMYNYIVTQGILEKKRDMRQ